MGLQRGLQVAPPAFALALGQMGRAVDAVLCGLGQGGNGATTLSQRLFRVAYQRHEDFALPPALAAKATHDLLEILVERTGLRCQRGGSRGTLRGALLDELEDFFCALYKVVASVTR